jgi:hypothetical protein
MCSTLLELDRTSSSHQVPSEDLKADFKRLASTSRLPAAFRDIPHAERHSSMSVAQDKEEEEMTVGGIETGQRADRAGSTVVCPQRTSAWSEQSVSLNAKSFVASS